MIAPQENFLFSISSEMLGIFGENFGENFEELLREGPPSCAGSRESERVPWPCTENPGENFGENLAWRFCGDSENIRTENVR
tara:strand:+ start:135 stop:380 length:246 start_codon:yes stop_codon:yes gene_type:complete